MAATCRVLLGSLAAKRVHGGGGAAVAIPALGVAVNKVAICPPARSANPVQSKPLALRKTALPAREPDASLLRLPLRSIAYGETEPERRMIAAFGSLEEVLVNLDDMNGLLDLDTNAEPNHQRGQALAVDQDDPCWQDGDVVASALAEAT